MRHGIYCASRARIPARSRMWRDLRDAGLPIVSTWIDSVVSAPEYGTIWQTAIAEIVGAERLILYVEPEDLPLLGPLVEVGAALAAGVPVFVVAHGVEDAALGSWLAHPGVTRCDTVAEAAGASPRRHGSDRGLTPR